jgi:cyclopropane-fatty-acyl-phospholipid synthase
MHRRLRPVVHEWEFPFYFYALDLGELKTLDRTIAGFGYNRRAPVSVRDADYLCGNGLGEFVANSEVSRVVLVTMARFLVKGFNPVSFYYCLRNDGSPVCVVAEVNNTFKERHLYILEGENKFPCEYRHEKEFHVSPFNNMDGHYEFNFSEPGEELSVDIKLVVAGQPLLHAAMRGNGVELTSSNLWKTMLRYPLTAALTFPRILWQAVLLRYRKKLPVFKKPAPASPMTIRSAS